MTDIETLKQWRDLFDGDAVVAIRMGDNWYVMDKAEADLSFEVACWEVEPEDGYRCYEQGGYVARLEATCFDNLRRLPV